MWYVCVVCVGVCLCVYVCMCIVCTFTCSCAVHIRNSCNHNMNLCMSLHNVYANVLQFVVEFLLGRTREVID